MPSGWRGKVLLPLEGVVQTIEAALDRLGFAFQKSYSSSLGRRIEVFSVTSPLVFTIKAREAGLRFSYSDPRRDTSLSLSTTAGSLPFLRSFVLEFARRLPHPPWEQGRAARKAADETWRKVFAASALLLVLGLANLLFAPLPFHPLAMLILNLVGIAVPLALIFLTHPQVESRIQRWRWRWWIEGPEFGALNWNEGSPQERERA